MQDQSLSAVRDCVFYTLHSWRPCPLRVLHTAQLQLKATSTSVLQFVAHLSEERQFVGAFAKLRRATISFVMSVRIEQLGCHWKFHIWVFFENLSRKFRFHENLTIIAGTIREDQYIFFDISRPFLLRTQNVSWKSCRQTPNTHFTFNNFFSRKSCRLWDNVDKCCRAGRGRPQMTV
jgi:hypothetical protein